MLVEDITKERIKIKMLVYTVLGLILNDMVTKNDLKREINSKNKYYNNIYN